MDVIAYLIGYAYTMNVRKQQTKTETRTQIFAKKESVSRAEFYNGGKAGLQPEFRLTTAIIDYNGELEVELDGLRYGIYRTYNVSKDYIELYCEKKGGLQP